MSQHLHTGRLGEHAARVFMEQLGYSTLAQNWRSGRDELDLVLHHPPTGTVVFAEVKTLTRTRTFYPEDAVTPAKQTRLARVAQAYLEAHQLTEHPARFDVLAVTLDNPAQPVITHYPDAFEAPRH